MAKKKLNSEQPEEKKKKSKAAYFTKVIYFLNQGLDIDCVNQSEYDVTVDEIAEFMKKRVKTKALKEGDKKLKQILNTLDSVIVDDNPNLVTFRRGENVSFYEYRNGVYTSLFDEDVRILVDKKMRELQLLEYRTKRTINDVTLRISALLNEMLDRHFDEETVDRQPWYLNLKNGLLDMKSFELRPHTPTYFSTSQIPFSFDPEAMCPKFQQFVFDISGGYPKMIQDLFGYCLSDGNKKHKIFYLHGTTARNGKSTLGKIVCGLLGDNNVSSLSLAQIASENTSILGSLVGSQLNFSDEVSSKYVESPALMSMSAEGSIVVDVKYKSAFKYRVSSKFLIACNDIPRFKEAQGMKHRTVIIPFPYQIPENKRIERYDEILLKEEGPGILNWAIQGAQLLATDGSFHMSEESLEEMHENELASNPVVAYLEDTYEFTNNLFEDSEFKMTAEYLYGKEKDGEQKATGFRAYMSRTGNKLLALPTFQKELRRYARETGKIQQFRTKDRNGIFTTRYYVGMKPRMSIHTAMSNVNVNEF